MAAKLRKHGSNDQPTIVVQRVQTGVRIEKRILKVLKGLAEYLDITLGDLLEGIVLHAFDGRPTFSRKTLERIRQLRKIYDLDLDASASHRMRELDEETRPRVLKRTP
jgi:hypothetical protein